MKTNIKLAFIGSGRMATAIIKGLIINKYCAPTQISCLSKTGISAERLSKETGINPVKEFQELIENSDIVFLALKPKNLDDLPKHFAELVKGKLIISVLAATPLSVLEKTAPKAKNIIRIMPNTPSQIGKGVTGYCSLNELRTQDSEQVVNLLNALGDAHLIEEEKMEAFTVIAGCGPAYFFEFASALEETARELGFPKPKAHNLVSQMLLGSAELLEQEKQSADLLRDQVAPPGGLTAAALEHMNTKDLRGIIKSAILEAKNKSEEVARTHHA